MQKDKKPVFITIHAEPDGLYLDKSDDKPWYGFENAYQFIKNMREEGSLNKVNFAWLLRADVQIKEIYGDSGWGLKKYHSEFGTLKEQGDELGLHVHPYRLKEDEFKWVQDFSDAEWMSHCVEVGVKAFIDNFQRQPLSFSIGPNSTYNSVVQACRSLGLKYDFTLSRNGKKDFNRIVGEIKGKMNWCELLPEYPYTPLESDISKESRDSDDYFLIPVQYFLFQHGFLNIKGILKKMILGKSDYRKLKPSLAMPPHRFKETLKLMQKQNMEYLLIDTRTHVFSNTAVHQNIRTNLMHLEEIYNKSIITTTPSSGICEEWSKKRKSI